MLSRLPNYILKKKERVLKAERLAAQRRIKCVLHDQKMRLDAARQKGDKAARKELRQAKLAARAWIRAKVRWALTSKEALALTVAREVLDYITTKSFALLRQMMHQRHLRRRRNALAVLKSRALEAQHGLQRNAIETLCRKASRQNKNFSERAATITFCSSLMNPIQSIYCWSQQALTTG